MRLRSFHASNMTEAMRQVRAALGDDAIIVSTRDEDGGGVRVTAAIDERLTPSPLPSVLNQGQDEGPMFEADIDPDEGSQIVEQIAHVLVSHNVPTALAERLLAAALQFAHDDPVMALGSAFDTHLPFADHKDMGSKPVMLIGPPGSGKTMGVARLATGEVLARRKAALIAADNHRAGAKLQLEAFARILETDLIQIDDAPALRDAVGLHHHEARLFIDTAACNPYCAEDRERTIAMIRSVDCHPVLVLAAEMDAGEAIDQIELFRAMGATHLMLTRMDCMRRMGNVLRIAFEGKMQLWSFTNGPKVTEPPQPFNPIALAKMVLPKDMHREMSDLIIDKQDLVFDPDFDLRPTGSL